MEDVTVPAVNVCFAALLCLLVVDVPEEQTADCRSRAPGPSAPQATEVPATSVAGPLLTISACTLCFV